ncbi:hypothetical protein B0H13DRAFT_1154782 [Mycena leptocephala]|nr:hypothetical protein B0H13DRAFT_1154782 [Mycena leptocephala]
MDAAPRHVMHRVDRRYKMDDQATRRSPLLLLPPELLELIALYLATGPPNLGPPAALLPLLSTCRAVHDRLGWGAGRWTFWARIANAKFTSCTDADAPYVPYDGYPYAPLDPAYGHATHGNSALEYRAHTLRTRCLALALLRRGDPHAPGAGRALRVAYGMLVEEGGLGERLDFSQVDIVLGRATTSTTASTSPENANEGEWRSKTKNRRQLTWANTRAFAWRYIRERMYVGRFGKGQTGEGRNFSNSNINAQPSAPRANADSDPEDRHWQDSPAWRAGWPRPTQALAAALWVAWFFEGEDALRAEPEPLRRHHMSLLLPMVVAPFRYASALAPPHHYSVPLLARGFQFRWDWRAACGTGTTRSGRRRGYVLSSHPRPHPRP